MNFKGARKASNSGRGNLEQELLGVNPLVYGPIGEPVSGLVVTSGHVLNGNSSAGPRHLLYDTAA